MKFFYDMDLADLNELCAAEGWPKYRAKQLLAWQARSVLDFAEMTDLSKAMRERLQQLFGSPALTLLLAQVAQDGTRKYAFRLPDGQTIEAVLMQHNYGNSLCLSSQCGCRMGCAFCASTGPGFGRNLTAGEMLAQLAFASRDSGQRVERIVIMGIGEPLDNYDEIMRFFRRVHDPDLYNLSYRHITLSTCGLLPEIKRLAAEDIPITLSLSLHAPNQKIREQLMPIARQYDYDATLAACREYFAISGRRVSFEYALFRGVNDQPEHARELAERLRGMNCHVNLIPANPVPGTGFQASRREDTAAFMEILEKAHIPVSLRRSLGQEITAACGQLRRQQLLAEKGRQ